MDDQAQPAGSNSRVPTGGALDARQQLGHYAPQLPRMPALDGMRALAVAAVLLYHADLMWIPGGFIGVEVFFVISGYLITSLLLTEWRDRGSISLPAFWLRRARRLLPAVYLLIGVVLGVTVVAFPEEVASLRGDAIASFVYVENWYLIFENESYFEAMGRLSMLRHLWSLAVEEQFYIIWPVVLTLLLKVARRRLTIALVVVAAIDSALLMAVMHVPEVDPSRVYFGTDTRAFSLLIGSTLAFLWQPGQAPGWATRLPRWVADAIAVAALAALLAFSLTITEFAPFLYRGGFVLICLSTAVLIAATTLPSVGLVTRALGWGPLTWIGVRSYSLYLWHWPVVCVTRPRLDVAFDGLPLLALRLVVTLVLAELSYRFVETPIRRGAIGRTWASLARTSGRDRALLGMRWAATATAVVAGITVLGVQVAIAEHPAEPSYDGSPSSSQSLLVSSASEALAVPERSAEPESPIMEAKADGLATTATLTSQPSEVMAASTPASPVAALAASQPTASPATPTAAARQVVAPPGIPARLPPPPTAPATASAPRPDASQGRVETVSPGAALGTGGAAAYVTPVPPTATPAPTGTPLAVGPVFAVGDSVMLGASFELPRQIAEVDVDGAVSRQVSEVIAILRSRESSGRLPEIVVLHIGNNGVFTSGQFDEIMRLIGPRRRVIFLNVAVPRRWTEPNNAVLIEGTRKHPNVRLLDWKSIADGRPGLLKSDGIHLLPEGALVYTRLIVSTLRSAPTP